MPATDTVLMQNEIKEKLSMTSTAVISSNPNRENLKLIIKKRPATVGSATYVDDTICDVLMPFVKGLCELKSNNEKTIIYPNLMICGVGYEIVKREALRDSDCGSIMECVSQYHAPSTDKVNNTLASGILLSLSYCDFGTVIYLLTLLLNG